MDFIIVTNKNHEFFISELVAAFPEIADVVLDEDWTGLIHLQIGEFTIFTQKAIDSNNIPVIARCFQFVENVINKVSDEVREALEISWVFHLSFTKNENIFGQFPLVLKNIRIRLQQKENEYLKEISKDPG